METELLNLDHFRIRLTHAQLIAAHGQLHRITQRRNLAHMDFRPAGQSHVHDAALDGTFTMQADNHRGFPDLDILQGFHAFCLLFLSSPAHA